MYSSRTLLALPTEVLTQIFAYLPFVDLLSVQLTCHETRNIVANTAYLQYILRTQVNGVDDFLPPGFPCSERLKLLRRHEKSWNSLRYSIFTEFATSIGHHHDPDCYTLRDGYLIYEDVSGTKLRYGYVDLCSTVRNQEPRWVHIIVEDIRLPLPAKVVFAVDHDLVVAISKQGDDLVQLKLAFFQFTTGIPHTLSSTHTVQLPLVAAVDFSDVGTEMLGDYILTSIRCRSGLASFYLVSWKTGTVTLLREVSEMWTPLWGGAPKLTVIDSSLIALIKDSANCLEICKLDLAFPDPRLQTVCFLGFPPLTSDTCGVVTMAIKEWVPTAWDHARSQCSRGRLIPFYSRQFGTIGLLFNYHTYLNALGEPFRCTMIINIPAIHYAVRSNVRNVLWMDWGPSGTHVLETTQLNPAGPFWIANTSPLVVRDYNMLRTRCIQSTTEHTSSSPSEPLVFSSTEVFGEHWVGSKVETRLPHRNVMANHLDLHHFSRVMADREWIIGIETVEAGTFVTVYHVD